MAKDWQLRLNNLRYPGHIMAGMPDYVGANFDSVAQVLGGLGPDSTTPTAGAGAHIVFNMSCKHVPKFCSDSDLRPDAYENAWSNGRSPSVKRRDVDAIVERCATSSGATLAMQDIYFAALETSGSGIRFYGDMCLVLKPAASVDLLVLDRNSYDIVREPIATEVANAIGRGAQQEQARCDAMLQWLGKWNDDLAAMVSLKIAPQMPAGQRRWTTGQIAQAILDDEDYCEVLYPRSFNAADIAEVRVSAADAAAEGDITHREQNGEGPALHEIEWRQQRRDARRSLARHGIEVRVITTGGRSKG